MVCFASHDYWPVRSFKKNVSSIKEWEHIFQISYIEIIMSVVQLD